jgi:hypothetical protein
LLAPTFIRRCRSLRSRPVARASPRWWTRATDARVGIRVSPHARLASRDTLQHRRLRIRRLVSFTDQSPPQREAPTAHRDAGLQTPIGSSISSSRPDDRLRIGDRVLTNRRRPLAFGPRFALSELYSRARFGPSVERSSSPRH